MIASNITIRLKLANQPGTLAKVLTVIGQEGGSLGAIDLISASPTYLIRELIVRLNNNSLERVVDSLRQIPGVQSIYIADRVFTSHLGGKIEINPKRPIHNREDLSMIYTPGVASICKAIDRDRNLAYKLTMKGNSVAIVTDGSAVLGLGNLGPLAALPVRKAKQSFLNNLGMLMLYLYAWMYMTRSKLLMP